MLLAGKLPMIQLTDNHPLRMQEVNTLNNNPTIRQNPNLGNLVRQYIQAHFQQWLQMPPLLAAALGIQPPPPQGGAAPTPPEKGQPGKQPPVQTPPHPQNKPPTLGVNNPMAKPGQPVKGPNMPQMPQRAPQQLKQNMAQITPSPAIPPR